MLNAWKGLFYLFLTDKYLVMQVTIDYFHNLPVLEAVLTGYSSVATTNSKDCVNSVPFSAQKSLKVGLLILKSSTTTTYIHNANLPICATSK